MLLRSVYQVNTRLAEFRTIIIQILLAMFTNIYLVNEEFYSHISARSDSLGEGVKPYNYLSIP